MSRDQKIVKKWRNSKNSKQPVELSEVEIVLYGMLSDFLIDKETTGSHLYKLKHPEFNRIGGATNDGIITIPTHNKKVKRIYVEKLLKVIEILEEKEN